MLEPGPEYWPWWVGGLALSGLAISHWLFQGRTLGVSGLITRIVGAVGNRQQEQAASAMASRSSADLEAALLAATQEAAGEAGLVDEPAPSKPPPEPPRRRLGPQAAPLHIPVGANLLFFAMLVAGGLLASVLNGTWEAGRSLGAAHEAFMGDGLVAVLPLLLGGIMVGFGTRMGSGCTSGHGLSGCSRLQPSSLVATGCFFGVAVALSLVMEAWGG